jgi:hypothetical protein
MYWHSPSRVLGQPAGIRTEPSLILDYGMSPFQHVSGQTLIEKLPLQKKGDHRGAEVLAEPAKIQGRDVHEPTLAVEAPFQHDGV